MKKLWILAGAALAFGLPLQANAASKAASGAAKAKATSSAAKNVSGAAKAKATSSAAKSKAHSKH